MPPSISLDEHTQASIFEARDLPIKDVSGSSDPYIKVFLLPDRKKKFQTKVHRKNLNPVFNETFLFRTCHRYAQKQSPNDLENLLCFLSNQHVEETMVDYIFTEQIATEKKDYDLDGAEDENGPAGALKICSTIPHECLLGASGTGAPAHVRKARIVVPYEELRQRYLQFSVYDFDRFSRHDLIGHVVLRGLLDAADLHQDIEYTMNILAAPQEKKDLGELMLSLCYLPTAGRLTVTVIKGRNLKAMDINGSSGTPVHGVAAQRSPFIDSLLCGGTRQQVGGFGWSALKSYLTLLLPPISVISLFAGNTASSLDDWRSITGMLLIGYRKSGSRARSLDLSTRRINAITLFTDPYVKICLICQGKRIKKKKTTVKKNTLSPVYNEALVFDLPAENVYDVTLLVKVIDYDRIGPNELIGCTAIGSTLIGIGRDHWLEMLDTPRKPVAQWYPLAKSLPANACVPVTDQPTLNCLNGSRIREFQLGARSPHPRIYLFAPSRRELRPRSRVVERRSTVVARPADASAPLGQRRLSGRKRWDESISSLAVRRPRSGAGSRRDLRTSLSYNCCGFYVYLCERQRLEQNMKRLHHVLRFEDEPLEMTSARVEVTPRSLDALAHPKGCGQGHTFSHVVVNLAAARKWAGRPVQYHTLAEYRREVIVSAVLFNQVNEENFCDSLPPPAPSPLLQLLASQSAHSNLHQISYILRAVETDRDTNKLFQGKFAEDEIRRTKRFENVVLEASRASNQGDLHLPNQFSRAVRPYAHVSRKKPLYSAHDSHSSHMRLTTRFSVYVY
ncbi:Synaptotagmin-9 [Eumeta japonica]|uniref:Synaptotagmin-9 n=1 Tax=Eumeta variegata TaxID=151549 RepID=A0A4C1XNP8_EUMVA|nr:Synaptotagmin-9 [Eumeta japonica]